MVGGVELRGARARREPPQQLFVESEARGGIGRHGIIRARCELGARRAADAGRAVASTPRAALRGAGGADPAQRVRRGARRTCDCEHGAHHCPVCSATLSASMASAPPNAPSASMAVRYSSGNCRRSMLPDEIAEERRGALVAHLQDLGEQRLARPPLAVLERVQQDDGRFLAAVQHQPLHRLAPHERLGVGEQRHQLLQAFGAAELAQQERRRAPDLPALRVHQRPDRLRAPRAEADQDVAQPPPRRARPARPRAPRRAAR